MGWVRGSCKGKDVWVEVDAQHKPVVRRGRVGVRYSGSAGAKVYRAGASNVEVTGSVLEDLPAGGGSSAKRGSGRGSGFGKAGTRTPAQAAAAAAAAAELVASFPDDAVVAFTDGACHGNPGPAGAGAVVRLPEGRRIEVHRALGRGTNNIGELTAILMAFEVLDEEGVPAEARVEVLTDSSYARGVLTQGWKAKANKELVAAVKDALGRRPQSTVHWVAGHAGVPDNERADQLATQGVEESRARGL